MFHAGSLLALHEGDAPYLLRLLADGDMETAGRLTYGGQLKHNFTAHPKIDPITGEEGGGRGGFSVVRPLSDTECKSRLL